MIIVVGVMVVRMYIVGEQNPCWFHSQTHILKMTVSWYMIAGSLLVLPTQLLTTLSTDYCYETLGHGIIFIFFSFIFLILLFFFFILFSWKDDEKGT